MLKPRQKLDAKTIAEQFTKSDIPPSSSFSFWGAYSYVYDTISRLIPYRDLMERVVEMANIKTDHGILDAGCGTGNLELELAKTGRAVKIMAIDSSPTMLARAKLKSPIAVGFRQIDLNSGLNSQGVFGPFDAILSVNVLYALDKPEKTLKRLANVAAPDAVMVQSLPKQGAKLLPILWHHRREAIRRSEKHHIFRLTLRLLVVALFNVVIMLRHSSGKYHFPSKDEVIEWHLKAGWDVSSIESAYAGQNWLIVSKKIKKGQHAA